MEDGRVSATVAGTPQGGVISPLLSNIYLHVLDAVWTQRHAHLGVLVRYADDFVVMCDTKAACAEAEQRVRTILTRLGLELHPDKTRQVDLSRGRQGFDFLGCHLHKRKGRNLRPGVASGWTRDPFEGLGLYRLRGTVQYPGTLRMPRSEISPVSRVREIRMHGLKGGPAPHRVIHGVT